MKTAIIGLGYVGLPLCIQFSKSGLDVLGLDIDSEKTKCLNRGESYIKHIGSRPINEMVQSGRFEATTDFSRVAGCLAAIICVPTPLNKNREPDISYVFQLHFHCVRVIYISFISTS